MKKALEQKRISSLTNSQIKFGKWELEKIFPVVQIEQISLNDEFLQYESDSKVINRVKNNIITAKKIGMKNFRKAAIDPSFGKNRRTIIYCVGRKPAVKKSPIWWDKVACKFMPEKNSRLMSLLERDVFLGVLVKELIEEEGYSVKDAWEAVCVNSKNIGYATNKPFLEKEFALTGSKKISRWYDLGNTRKIIKVAKKIYLVCGFNYNMSPKISPVAINWEIIFSSLPIADAVGEIVIDE